MAFSWTIAVLGLFCQTVAFCTGQMIYHQTMTPSWLKEHASYIDSSHTAKASELAFNAGSVANAALLRVPLVAPNVLDDSASLTVEITVATNVSIGGKKVDSDIRYGVSDGTRFIGFAAFDTWNFFNHAPCRRVEGKSSGSNLTSIKKGPTLPKPSDSLYPGKYIFTLKLDERWGSCYTANDAGFTKETEYKNQLLPSLGLDLEVYKTDARERVGIKYIKVAIMQDTNILQPTEEVLKKPESSDKLTA
ncbi:hypothetical protein ACROYT_G031464 [Oculina patagonica]